AGRARDLDALDPARATAAAARVHAARERGEVDAAARAGRIARDHRALHRAARSARVGHARLRAEPRELLVHLDSRELLLEREQALGRTLGGAFGHAL